MSLLEHIGWDLVRAARVWTSEFTDEVVAAGHPWFAEARGQLVQHIGPNGVDQGALAERSGLTKQAVAQHLDVLEAEGLIVRENVASDSRRRRVVWTDLGRTALRDIDSAKSKVEARIRRRLGTVRFTALREGLQALAKTRQDA